MKYKNLIFDVGNVLLDYRWREMLTVDYGMTDEQMHAFAKKVFFDPLWEELDRARMPYGEVVNRYAEKYPEDETEIRWFFEHSELMFQGRPAVWERIRALKKQGHRIYLLSNYSEDMFKKHIALTGLEEILDGQMVSYEITRIKPDPEIYQALFARYGLNPAECLFFDDREENVRGSRACGMEAVHVISGEQLVEELDRIRLQNYQYFLFDLDGTLTEPKEGITRCVQYALDSFGIHVEDLDTLVPFIGPPLADSFERFYGFTPEQAVAARDKYRERYLTIGMFENAVIPGIPELLASLKAQGKNVALATSKPEVMAVKILEKYDLLPFFDVTVGSGMNGEREEKWEVIEEVFRRLGITGDERQRALMIGDRKYDILGAKRCGIDSLGTYIGYAAPGELEEAGAEYVAGDMAEMLAMLGCEAPYDEAASHEDAAHAGSERNADGKPGQGSAESAAECPEKGTVESAAEYPEQGSVESAAECPEKRTGRNFKLSILPAEERQYGDIRHFYHSLIDGMAEAGNPTTWIKDVYPAPEFLWETLEKREIYIGYEGSEIAAVMVLNHRYNDEYRTARWEVSREDEEIMVMHALGVHPRFSGRGYGRAMVQEAMRLAREAGASALRLDVLKTNEPARQLYIRCGFTYQDELKLYYENTGWAVFELYEYIL